jgi:hypothetical protein
MDTDQELRLNHDAQYVKLTSPDPLPRRLYRETPFAPQQRCLD